MQWTSYRCYWTVICTALNLDTSQKSEPALELINRAVPSVEAHQHRKKFRRKGDKKKGFKCEMNYNKAEQSKVYLIKVIKHEQERGWSSQTSITLQPRFGWGATTAVIWFSCFHKTKIVSFHFRRNFISEWTNDQDYFNSNYSRRQLRKECNFLLSIG